jgi:hypothetical protein
MADEKEKAIGKGQEPKPITPEALPDELSETDFERLSGGQGSSHYCADQY